MMRLLVPALLALFLALPAAAQPAASTGKPAPDKVKIEKQKQNEEAESLCRAIPDKDKFDECMDLYFLDEVKFRQFLEAHKKKG